MGMAPNVPTWFVFTPGLYEGQEPFLECNYDKENLYILTTF